MKKNSNARPSAEDKNTEDVQKYIDKLDSSLQQPVQELRSIILNSDKLVGEHIKWNSPAFYYTGPMQDFDPKEYLRDLVVMNLNRGRIKLVFPTGAKLGKAPGLNEKNYPDGRKIISFDDPADTSKSIPALTALIRQWIGMVV